MEKITKEQAERLVTCPDCAGRGNFSLPTRNQLHKYAVCARCDGRGYVESFENQKETTE